MSRSAPPPWLRRATLEVALVVAALAAAGWVLFRLRTLIFYVAIALFISVALEPAVQFLTRRGWKRRRAGATVFFGSGLVVLAFLAALVPLLVSQAAAIADDLPRYLENVSGYVADLGVDVELIDDRISDALENASDLLGRYGSLVAGGVFAVGNSVLGALFAALTIGLFAYFAVAEGPALRKVVLSFLPQATQREVLRMWEIAVAKTGGYIYSRLVLAIISAAVTAGALALLGVPYAIALGMWVGVISQFVPVVGAYIAAVLPVLVALFSDPLDAVWVIVLLVAYQQVENLVVAPRITARAMAIHPAVSVGAVLAGAALLGGIGAVLALPVAATIQAFISTMINRHEVVESPLLAEGGAARGD